jgi:hypothetical protein
MCKNGFVENCSADSDVRGMCFICSGLSDNTTWGDFKKIARCPQTPYAFAYWLYNNHKEFYEVIKSNLCNNKTDKSQEIVSYIGKKFGDIFAILYEWLDDEELYDAMESLTKDD